VAFLIILYNYHSYSIYILDLTHILTNHVYRED